MRPEDEPEFLVDFPTLGYLVGDWIEQHCIIPDGWHKGQPYRMADWQLWCTCNHYRVRPDAAWDPVNPRVSTNFVYRRSQVIAPQKTGKGPWLASIITAEGLGPTVFAGWAEGGEVYACSDHGCDCGWTSYRYDVGEPMGIPRPTPLIQLTATSRDHTANVYNPLKVMFRRGGLVVEQARTGEERIRLPDDGEIATVTSSAKSKLGNPVTFVGQDETGVYTKSNGMIDVADTQNRGLAGMDARGIETTNPWDPSEQSTAQMTFESPVTDIFRFYREPPKAWRYTNREDRGKIHRFVYRGSWWVNLDAIEGLALELIARGETAQAERFYGNRVVQGTGAWLKEGAWGPGVPLRTPKREICLGFDGSTSDDWTVIRAEDIDGFQFTPTHGPDAKPTIWDPKAHGGRVPRLEVHAAVAEIFKSFDVERFYCDPKDWQTEIEDWELLYGDKCVAAWATNRPKPMYDSLERFVTDLTEGRIPHDECRHTGTHMANARKVPVMGDKYILAKPMGAYHQKIDAAMASALAHEAACDARVAGWAPMSENYVYY